MRLALLAVFGLTRMSLIKECNSIKSDHSHYPVHLVGLTGQMLHTHTNMHVNMSEKVHDHVLKTILKVKKKVHLMQTKYLVHKDTNTKYTMYVISMQAGWFRVEQTVGPKHTNTSGDYIQWCNTIMAPIVLHQMLPRGPTSTHTHTHSQSCKEGTHKNAHT